jgi:predicted MPP superfamily phosphohydrolase
VAAAALCFAYAFAFEADWLQVTHHEVRTSKLKPGERIRIVHLTDLHVAGSTRALRELPALVNAQHPDLVIYTGDSLNAASGLPEFREVLGKLDAPGGRYAVKGNHDIWYWLHFDLFGGGVATELRGPEPLVVSGGKVALCGAPYGDTRSVEACLRRAPPEAVSVLAYHTPDLVERVAPLGVELYLAGHTHGGQVRAPLYGAIVTFSDFGKRYEMGLYRVGGTALYVNRGIGFEPTLPRVRFLARPEIAVIDLVGG